MAVLTVLMMLAFVAAAGAAKQKRSVRVGAEYFGVNYPLMLFDSPAVRARQLSAIRGAGFEQVRVAISWRNLEPQPPVNGVHSYDISRTDYQVEALARNGLRMQPSFLLAPWWAARSDAWRCAPGSATAGVEKIGDYAAAAKALAYRYGKNGSFWRDHPDIEPMPIRTWEIWNEPNLRTYWCPEPDPAAYAELFAQAARAIKSAQPRARVVTAGLSLSDELNRPAPVGEYLAGMSGARPELWRLADGAGIHLFPSGELREQLIGFAQWRNLLTATGTPTSTPMYATEVGWGLAGPFGLSEQARAERYRFVTERLPRSNCNVAMMNAQAWTTSHAGPVWDYAAGIVDPLTAALFPSAVAFRDGAGLMRGETRREPPHRLLENCEGMPKLDRDDDGRAEHRDYYPLDPRRWRGPKGW